MNKRLGYRLAWWESTKKEASHLLGLRGRHQYSGQSSSRIRAPCVASAALGTEGEEDQIARSSAEHLDGLERNDFCDFDKPHKRAYQKEKTESNEQSKEGGQPK